MNNKRIVKTIIDAIVKDEHQTAYSILDQALIENHSLHIDRLVLKELFLNQGVKGGQLDLFLNNFFPKLTRVDDEKEIDVLEMGLSKGGKRVFKAWEIPEGAWIKLKNGTPFEIGFSDFSVSFSNLDPIWSWTIKKMDLSLTTGHWEKEITQALTIEYPQLEELSINYGQLSSSHIQLIKDKHLNKLRKLRLKKVEFEFDSLSGLLSSLNNNLSCLDLGMSFFEQSKSGGSPFSNSFAWTQNLKNLEISNVDLSQSDWEEILGLSFPELKKLDFSLNDCSGFDLKIPNDENHWWYQLEEINFSYTGKEKQILIQILGEKKKMQIRCISGNGDYSEDLVDFAKKHPNFPLFDRIDLG